MSSNFASQPEGNELDFGSASRGQPNSQLPSEIRAPLSQLRWAIRRYLLSQTAILTVLVFAICFWTFAALDYLPIKVGISESPKWARVAMQYLTGLALLGTIYFFGLRRIFTRWTNSALALLIESKHSNFQSSLITTVQGLERPIKQNVDAQTGITTGAGSADIERGDSHAESSAGSATPSMIELSQRQAVDGLRGVDVTQMVRWTPVVWQLIAMLLVLTMSLGFAWANPDWTAHWKRRFWDLSDERWPRATRIRIEGIDLTAPLFTGEKELYRYRREFDSGRLLMPRGASGVFRIAADMKAKQIPDSCMVRYAKSDGTRGRAMMRRLTSLDEEWLPFILDGAPFDSIDQSFSLSIAANDTRVSGLRIEMTDSPLIVDATIQVRRPAYLARTVSMASLDSELPYRLGSSVPEGSDVTLRFEANKQLARAEYVVQDQNQADSQAGGEPSDLFEKETPDSNALKVTTVAVDGTGFRIPLGVLMDNQSLEIRLWDTDGLVGQQIQRYTIAVEKDDSPSFDLALRGIGNSITANAKLPMKIEVADDYGISETQVVLHNQPASTLATRLPPSQYDFDASSPIFTLALDSTKREFETLIDLAQLAESEITFQIGDQLLLRGETRDFYDLGTIHRGIASPIGIEIVTPDKLLLLLEQRELEVRARLENVILELTQMRTLLEKYRADVLRQPDIRSAQRSTPNESDGVSIRFQLEEDDPERLRRLQSLRVQQALTQEVKSHGETKGVESAIATIRDELINNRVDNPDRIDRLENKIRQNLDAVLTSEFPSLKRSLGELLNASDTVQERLSVDAMKNTDAVLSALQAILQDMIDIQDFNEVLDMVRSMVDEQDRILEETKSEQKRQILDLDFFNE